MKISSRCRPDAGARNMQETLHSDLNERRHFHSMHLLHGALGMVHGAWCIVQCPWCMEHGTLCMLHNPWCMVHGACCMLHGACCMRQSTSYMCLCLCMRSALDGATPPVCSAREWPSRSRPSLRETRVPAPQMPAVRNAATRRPRL